MLLNEITKVANIAAAAQKRDDKKKELDRLEALQKQIKDNEDFNDPDELGSKRRAKLSPADKFRDIARQLRNLPPE